ncbi:MULTISPECIES: hypothetical protein, partial [unclassified Pseudomonas]|uniref:hypothetical protein n=1 Tax=unclassified Pseudomonas TaxID=196821 RepID=UPI0021CA7EA5
LQRTYVFQAMARCEVCNVPMSVRPWHVAITVGASLLAMRRRRSILKALKNYRLALGGHNQIL